MRTDVLGMKSEMITITANGEERHLPSDATVVGLLDEMGIDAEQSGIAVAVDDAVVPRSEWSRTTLPEGARVEVITATQGG